MATENHTAAATLKNVAQEHKNQLHDVVVLLEAIQDRIEAQDVPATPLEASEQADGTIRLAQMARAKVQAAIVAFDAHI